MGSVPERESESESSGLSRTWRVTVSLAVAGLVAWFFFAWLALDRNVVDAAGESVGTGLALLLVISISAMVLKRG